MYMDINSMNQLIDKYVGSKQFAWSASTAKSERHRLYAIAIHLTGNPVQLWEALAEYKPYSRLTIWTRVTDFHNWMIEEGIINDKRNPFKEWRKKNAKAFRNVYTRKVPSISFEATKARINTIGDDSVRAKALQLLTGGLRFAESGHISDGICTGKGGKKRRVYVEENGLSCNHSRLYRALRHVGLTPHGLRKICLNELVRKGMGPFDLMKFAGWSSLTTAQSYIEANDSNIEKLVGELK
jgi:integrase